VKLRIILCMPKHLRKTDKKDGYNMVGGAYADAAAVIITHKEVNVEK